MYNASSFYSAASCFSSFNSFLRFPPSHAVGAARNAPRGNETFFCFSVEKSEIWREKLWGRWLNSQADQNNNKKTLLLWWHVASGHFFELCSSSSFVAWVLWGVVEETFDTCQAFYSSLTYFTSFGSIQFDFQRVRLRSIYLASRLVACWNSYCFFPPSSSTAIRGCSR